MATYFVSRTGNGSAPTTDPGTSGSWTGAYATFAAALAAASTAGDIIKVSDEHYEAFTADTTFTILNNISVICVDHADTSVQSTMDGTTGYLKATSGNSNITVFGAYSVYIFGIYFGAYGSDFLGIAAGSSADGCDYVLDSCTLALNGGSGSSNYFRLGGGANSINSSVTLVNSTFVFSHAGQYINTAARTEMIGCTMSGTAPSELFKNSAVSDPGGAFVRCYASDLSLCTSTLVGSCTQSSVEYFFSQCKLGASVAWLTSSPSPANGSNAHVTILDCDDGDEHYHFGYQNAFGVLTVDTGIYANDGAEWSNGSTNPVSWKIVTTANASFQHPFKTPFISVHHEGTSAITPSIEIVRSGSATAYQDDEVWSQWTYKGTSGSTKATFDNSDRMTDFGSPADQTAGALGASDWTGENATSWFGKLSPTSSITPAELGDISARVCVGLASATVYIDPQIRGLS